MLDLAKEFLTALAEFTIKGVEIGLIVGIGFGIIKLLQYAASTFAKFLGKES